VPLLCPIGIRNLVAVGTALEVVFRAEEPRVNDVAVLAVSPCGDNCGQVGIAGKVHAYPARFVLQLGKIDGLSPLVVNVHFHERGFGMI
jgi:hypothetical protein